MIIDTCGVCRAPVDDADPDVVGVAWIFVCGACMRAAAGRVRERVNRGLRT